MHNTRPAMVHPIRGAGLIEMDKRHGERVPCAVESTSRPAELGDGMAWGGVVRDLSVGGLKLNLCFPFRPGTYLAVDVQAPANASSRTLICRVVHVHDEKDGTWTLGCSFLRSLGEREMALLI